MRLPNAIWFPTIILFIEWNVSLTNWLFCPLFGKRDACSAIILIFIKLDCDLPIFNYIWMRTFYSWLDLCDDSTTLIDDIHMKSIYSTETHFLNKTLFFSFFLFLFWQKQIETNSARTQLFECLFSFLTTNWWCGFQCCVKNFVFEFSADNTPKPKPQ